MKHQIKKYWSLLIVVLFFTAVGYAQELPSKKELGEINREYQEKLKLSKEDADTFEKILIKYNNQLIKLDSSLSNFNSEFNKVVKLLDLEVYKLLNRENWNTYKKNKNSIEPYKKYRL